jgi:ferredoxin
MRESETGASMPIERDGAGPAEGRFSVRIQPDGIGFRCAAEQSLLAAMESVGIGRNAVGCRGGGCGRCRIRVVDGTIARGKMSRAHVSAEQERQGYALACRAYPRSDLVVSLAPLLGPGGAG